MDYVFSSKTKKVTLITAGVGLLLFLIGTLTDSSAYTSFCLLYTSDAADE